MRQHFGGPILVALLAGTFFAGSAVTAVAAHPEEGGEPGPGMERMDVNKDGKIDRADFVARHKEMFARMDQNGDGTVTLDEMRAAHEKMREERRRRMEERMFGRLDANGDGKLNEEELVARGEKAFAELDENGDGVISRKELRHRMMDRMRERRHHGMQPGGHGDGGGEDEGGEH